MFEGRQFSGDSLPVSGDLDMLRIGTSLFWAIRVAFQFITMALLIAAGLAATAATLAAALGHLPWLDLTLTFGGIAYPEAGIVVQVAGTALIVGLLAYLPGNARVLALETSHRRFQITMEDVTRAYRIAHAADRGGLFQMKSEFDSVRERIAYLRDHPDLAELEAPVIEVAAQMSHLSRDLARVYSDDAVRRATDFLTQRQNEVDDFNRRLDAAKSHAVALRSWIEDVEMDEAVAEAQLARICEELTELLPELTETETATETGTAAVAAAIAARGDETAPASDRVTPREISRDWIEDLGEDAPAPRDSDIVELLSRRAAQ